MPMDRAKKNVVILAACQALLFTGNVILIALNGLVGFSFAADKSLATLPITTFVVGAAVSTIPASMWMRHVGRRAGFMSGATIGLFGALLSTYAVYISSFWALCTGTALMGIYSAFGQYYRFAAADVASASFKSKAISLVMAGGIAGGILGPESTKLTRDLAAPEFIASYASMIGFCLLALILLWFIDIPPLSQEQKKEQGRPLSRIMRQPVFVVAVLAATIGYGVMNLIMTATPLAMSHHQHPFNDAAFVIEWHVIGMFAPSFFTGSLIDRFGVYRIMLFGAALMAICVVAALSGIGLLNFWVALVLLGVGWNFLFVGGTTLLTEAYAPAERAKTQAANDFIVFSTVAASSLLSGSLLYHYSWQTVNYAALPFITLVALAIVWLMLRQARAATA